MTRQHSDSEVVMGLLKRRLPLLLLLDLADPDGPRSSELLDAERSMRRPSRVWESVRAGFVPPDGMGTQACTGRHEVCGHDDPCHLRCWASPLVALAPTG